MVGQHVLLGEPGLALVAREWLLSCVSPAVHLEGRVLGKAGPAVGALERLRARVRPFMQRQRRFRAEGLSAIRADVSQVVTFVHLSLVADDVLLPFEGLVAGVAGEEPLGAVDVLLVDLQVAAVSEDLLAGLAAIDDICFHSMVRADVL